jgi:flagellar hook-basal body complex protein FliE
MNNSISGLRILPVETPASSSAKQAGGTFLENLHEAIDKVEQLHSDAEQKVSAMLAGNGMDVHSAMIAVEKADLSFQLMMQVRNKIVQAYQEVSRMQF